MNKKDDKRTNELMDIEDQMVEEMKEAFRKRLEKRLQERVKSKEAEDPEIRGLKKKGRSNST